MSHPSARLLVHHLVRVRNVPFSRPCNGTSFPALCWDMLNRATTSTSVASKKLIHTTSEGDENEADSRNVVRVSSMHSQDGLDIQEMPVLVRLLDKDMVHPLTNYTFTGERIQPKTAEEENFQSLLQECASVRDVFRLLEIPFEKVTGYSASAALLRMNELQKMNADWDDLHSFIRTAVMNELNYSVKRDVALLSNETIMSLVTCYMEMDSFSSECRSAINGEIEKRIVDEQFSIEELCSLSILLHESDKGDKDLINSVWIHIGNHYQDFTEDNIVPVMKNLPPSHRYLLKVFAKQTHTFWWKMKTDEVVACLKSLVQLNSLQVSMMMDFSRWFFLNIHQIKQDQLKEFLAAFVYFGFCDANYFMRALERYVTARKDRLDTDLLSLVIEYCLTRRFFSKRILDTAAQHFEQFGQSYSARQIFSILRAFGQLNYLPKDSQQFLLQTEKVLEERFSDFHPAHLVELLCSFAFVEKIPCNFIQKVLTPSFLSDIHGMEDSLTAGKWVEMLQSAVKLETTGVHIPLLYKMPYKKTMPVKQQNLPHSRLAESLQEIFGTDAVNIYTYMPDTIYTIDAEIHLDDYGIPMSVKDMLGSKRLLQGSTKLAILLMGASHYCVNNNHLLGEFAMRHRHLRKMGYEVIEMPELRFRVLSGADRRQFILQTFRDHFSGRSQIGGPPSNGYENKV